EHFLTTRNDLADFFGKKNFLMESFYRQMRRKLDLLMVNDQPVGGQWNYDANNRKRYDEKIPVPPPLVFQNNLQDIYNDLTQSGVDSFGVVDSRHFPYPVNRSQALDVMNFFNKYLLPYFGTYQDAMTKKSWSLFHSRLSFAMNLKMLHPLEVINSAVGMWVEHPNEILLSQIEGFVRQIIGWREYVRGVYWAKMPDYAGLNFFNHQYQLPAFYWTGETRMNCMKTVIKQSLDKAYAHHIQRLMITGNFALLANINPDDVDKWYLGIYIDAFEWVELTNTRGMSQYADGGIMASKPYVSSANYINKMSDYCQNCFYDHRKKSGNRSCPFNSLFWNFFEKHQDKLRKNPRIGMIYKNLERMSSVEKTEIITQAERYIDNPDDL
ncbi:MAG: cryptochrome/photolyase family protein, partial [Sphingobacteriia bacterium]|nr:cryptochrome/photolyase family protein [Sphingobacteriia bacterium]